MRMSCHCSTNTISPNSKEKLNMPNLSSLLDDLSSRLGLGELTLDATNPLSLCFDGKQLVTLNHDSDDRALLLSGVVAGAADVREETLRSVLQASCLGSRTGGGAFGLSPETGELLLWKRWNDEFPDYSAFEAALNQFLAQLEYWRNRLTEGAAEYAMAGATPEEMLPVGALRV
jgi:hypothetical protein